MTKRVRLTAVNALHIFEDMPSIANSQKCKAALFRNGRNQAMRIPKALELDCLEVVEGAKPAAFAKFQAILSPLEIPLPLA